MKTGHRSRPHTDIRRSHQRFHTQISWLDFHHSFSFSNHYDPHNTHHGLLLVSNDDVVRPNRGFRAHPHQDREIEAWVLDGELEHKDSGRQHWDYLPQAGPAHERWDQHLAFGDKDVPFIQMWVPPDKERIHPSYEQLDINGELEQDSLISIASGRGHDAVISIKQQGAVLWSGWHRPRELVQVPDSPYEHLFIAKGSIELKGAGVQRPTADAGIRWRCSTNQDLSSEGIGSVTTGII